MTKICWQCRSECDSLASVCPHCKARLGNRKASGLAAKKLGWIAWTGIGCGSAFLLAIILPVALVTRSIASSVQRNKADGGSYSKGMEGLALTPEDISAAETRFNKLLPLFTKETDKFSGGVLWRHKSFSKFFNGNGTSLSADIWNGSIRLTATYQGSDWIFFKDITVKAGASRAEAHGNPEHHVQDGVTEYLRIKDPQAGHILSLIKSAGEGPVEVRLNGKFYRDFTLKPAYKKGIQDTINFLSDLEALRQAGRVPKGVD